MYTEMCMSCVDDGDTTAVPYRNRERLAELYEEEGLTQYEIADRFDVAQSTISKWVRRFDLEPPATPASYYTHPNGYELWATDGTSALVHRLCAVAWFDEQLFVTDDDLHVHHDIPIPWLNTEDNLDVLHRDEHIDLHGGNPDWRCTNEC